MKTAAVYMMLSIIIVIGFWRLMNPLVEAKPAEVVVDHTYCRAKLANWVMRHEELAKPEKEMWESFRDYMTSECVK